MKSNHKSKGGHSTAFNKERGIGFAKMYESTKTRLTQQVPSEYAFINRKARRAFEKAKKKSKTGDLNMTSMI
jgi:hypothetical protein